MQISWPLQQQTEGEREESAACSPAPAPERGAKRAGAGTASWSPTLGEGGDSGRMVCGSEVMKRGTVHPAVPATQPVPRGLQHRTGAPWAPPGGSGGPQCTCHADPHGATSRGRRLCEGRARARARVRRTRGAAPPTRLPGRGRDPGASSARSPSSGDGPRGAPSPRLRSVPLLPPVAGLHLPSIAMMGSPWTAPTRWRGRGRA